MLRPFLSCPADDGNWYFGGKEAGIARYCDQSGDSINRPSCCDVSENGLLNGILCPDGASRLSVRFAAPRPRRRMLERDKGCLNEEAILRSTSLAAHHCGEGCLCSSVNVFAPLATSTAFLRVTRIETLERQSTRAPKGGEGWLGAGVFRQLQIPDAIAKHLF